MRTCCKITTDAGGKIVKIVSTDAGSVKDMQAFANQTGNPLMSSSEEKGEYIFMMQKK